VCTHDYRSVFSITRYTELESEHSTTQTGLENAHSIKQYTGLDSVHSITLDLKVRTLKRKLESVTL